MTSHRAGRCRRLSPNLELIVQQVAHTFIVHDHNHQVHVFHSDLRAPTATANRKEGWRAPAATGHLAGRNSTTVFSAHDESRLGQVRNYSDALRLLKHLVRDSFV